MAQGMATFEEKEINGLLTYVLFIDWSDPWLILLLTFHGSAIITTFLTRRHGNIQAFLFLAFLFMVYFSEQLNELGAKHWRSFSRQQYFDSRGMFISVVFSLPLLLNCLVMVCNWLWISGQLLVKLKRAQIKENNRCSTIAKEDKDK